MNKLATKGDSSLIVDSRFAGARNDPDRNGVIKNITPDNFTATELICGFIDAMSMELYWLYTRLGLKRTGLIASGSGIRKNIALIKNFEKSS